MKKNPKILETSLDGLLHGTNNVYITDGTSMPFLPSQNSTMTIMANAHRVATIYNKQLL